MLSEELLLGFIAFIAPCYLANAAPVIIAKLVRSRTPIDGGRCLGDGERILGDGKTWEGFCGGVFIGTLTGCLLNIIGKHTIPGAFLLSLGAMVGDALGSFIKRRLKIRRGGPLPVVDQLLFALVALSFYSVYRWPDPYYVLVTLIVTPPLHFITNVFAYLLKLKDVPW